MIHWVGESDGKKKKQPTTQTNLLLPVLLPGGSASQAAKHPPQPWWVRAPLMEQGIWGTSPLTGPPHSTRSWADNGERSSETAANSSKQAANKPTWGNSHLVLLVLSPASMFANNCSYLIQHIAYCNRKTKWERREEMKIGEKETV